MCLSLIKDRVLSQCKLNHGRCPAAAHPPAKAWRIMRCDGIAFLGVFGENGKVKEIKEGSFHLTNSLQGPRSKMLSENWLILPPDSTHKCHLWFSSPLTKPFLRPREHFPDPAALKKAAECLLITLSVHDMEGTVKVGQHAFKREHSLSLLANMSMMGPCVLNWAALSYSPINKL